MAATTQLLISRNRLTLLAGSLGIVGAALFMLWLSWEKWPDVLIDFGRELYIPWMLTEGKALYRDLLYFHGPLSPCWNAMWFRIFGAGLDTLVWVNLSVLLTILLLMGRALSWASSSFAALIACLVFVFVFAFSQYLEIGNYNYICPYSHEATHGMVLSWATLVCLMGHARSDRIAWLFGAGLCAGLVFMTKPEFFVAVTAASFSALGLWIYRKQPKSSVIFRSLALFSAAAAIFPCLAFGLLALTISPSEAGLGILGSWLYLPDTRITNLPFYRVGMGIHTPLKSLLLMFAMAGIYAGVLVPAADLSMKIKGSGFTALIVALLIFLVLIVLAWGLWEHLPLYQMGRPLPLFMILAGRSAFMEMRRNHEENHVAALILIVFALALTAKMLLYSRVFHYGFALGMPAAMVAVLALFDWIPGLIARRGGRPIIFYAAASGLILVIVASHVDLAKARYSEKTIAVGEGRDRFYADLRGNVMNDVVDWLKCQTGDQATIAVLPEGVMVNYLARRWNPTPLIKVLPPELIMFSEDRILTELQKAPPDYIALVDRDTSEYGVRFFGRDYGQRIMNWIADDYHSVETIGELPLQNKMGGIVIKKRNGDHVSSPSGEP